MSDLIKRLRDAEEVNPIDMMETHFTDLCGEAADELERKDKRIEELEEVFEAAQWFVIYTPAEHIPGLLERERYKMLKDRVSKLAEEQDNDRT